MSVRSISRRFRRGLVFITRYVPYYARSSIKHSIMRISERISLRKVEVSCLPLFIKRVNRTDLNRQRRIAERHSATYRSMRNTYFTRKRDNARLLLKQDAASASLHNFCVPPLGGSHYLPFASAHLISLFSPITTSDFPTRLNESSLMNFVKISNIFSRALPCRQGLPVSLEIIFLAKCFSRRNIRHESDNHRSATLRSRGRASRGSSGDSMVVRLERIKRDRSVDERILRFDRSRST